MNLHTLTEDPEGLPLVVEPDGDRSSDALAGWLAAHASDMAARLSRHGAILFRGFSISEPAAFERVARAVSPTLGKEYLGTSPRNALTEYVFSASELPGWYPIPQHCEMTFLARPPRRIFFWCRVAPGGKGGETPLVDFRKVQAALDPAVRQRFVDGGIRIVRNYTGPDGGLGRLNPFQLKRWDEMFLTTDRNLVEKKCRDEGFTPTWLPGGRLRLVSEQPALRIHPETGQPVWHNHVQVFHVGTGAAEYHRIYRDRRDLRSLGLWTLARALEVVERRKSSDDRALHCTYADGREIPEADLEHLRDVIWRHMVRFRWQAGDVVAIDNYAVSHGRMPYRGPREIAVAWADAA